MFIAFDGLDGAGKSTQVEMLEAYFIKNNIIHKKLDFGGNPQFKGILNKINAKEILVPAEVREYLYHFEGLYTNITAIQNKKRDEFIIIDRYYLSYISYGLLNGLEREEIDNFTKLLIEPDIYFYIDVDPVQIYQRIKGYRSFDAPEFGFKDAEVKGLFDERKSFISFQSKVREHYLNEIKESHNVLDGMKDIEVLHKEILHDIQRLGSLPLDIRK